MGEIASYFKPRQEAVTKVVTQNNMEPEAYAIGGGSPVHLGDSEQCQIRIVF